MKIWGTHPSLSRCGGILKVIIVKWSHFSESDQPTFEISQYEKSFYVGPCLKKEPSIKISSFLDSA